MSAVVSAILAGLPEAEALAIHALDFAIKVFGSVERTKEAIDKYFSAVDAELDTEQTRSLGATPLPPVKRT